MKKYITSIVIIISILFGANGAFAQGGYIYTAAGNGTAGYSGDGGLAVNAKLNSPTDVCEDHAGNLYIVDQGNNRIRQVNATTHIITTVVGNGASGYTGDGGAATAAELKTPNGVVVDGAGNIYIADQGNNVIRKVNTAGIISTIAGTGTAGFSGDGGPATAAGLNAPTSITVDAAGNLYIGDDGNHRIREVSTSGIITTIAGNGGSGSGGSFSTTTGVAATSVGLCTIHRLAVDAAGNVYFTNQGCIEFLKLTPAGLLYLEEGIFTPWGVSTDIAGNVYMATHGDLIIKANASTGTVDTLVRDNGGSSGSIGDGGLSINATVSSPNGIYADIIGNLYVADQGNNRIRMITSSVIATYNAGSFSVFVNEYCNGPQLTIATSSYSGTISAVTNFGDGTTNISTILPAYSGAAGYATCSHNYSLPGTYSLNTKLMNGATVVDSLTYTYEYTQCVTMPVKFYWDNNGNCIKDSGENFNSIPILVQIDSNGVPVDTISCTSGIYYTAHGSPSDIYAFRIIANGVAISCPSSGIIYDTIAAGIYNLSVKYVAVECPTSGFDLSVTDVVPVTGEHDEWGNIYVSNNYCTPTNATVVLHYDTHYNVQESTGGGLDVHPTPASYTDSTITWNVSGLTSATGPVDLYYAIWTDLACCGYLSAGQPIHSYVTVSPTVGDLDLANNNCEIWDTVRAGCDPNEMSVSPSGCIPQTSGENSLQYTITFTNVGNDTAFNIYVMDTLPNNVDPKSLRIVMSSNTMNTYMFNDGINNIVKFDFPAVNLLDSTVCPQCGGAVVFNIHTLPALTDGTTIFNHAGIFFDYNPVVLTNTVENTVGNCLTSTKNITAAKAGIQLFPNPASDELTIKIDQNTNVSFTITNSIGQEIISQPLLGTNGSTIQANVNVSTLPAGLYYISFRGDNGTEVKKFVKL